MIIYFYSKYQFVYFMMINTNNLTTDFIFYFGMSNIVHGSEQRQALTEFEFTTNRQIILVLTEIKYRTIH